VQISPEAHGSVERILQSARALIDAASAAPGTRREARVLGSKAFASYMAFSDACFFVATLDLSTASPFRDWPAPLSLAMFNVARYCDEALGLHAMLTRQPANPRRLEPIAHPEDAEMLRRFASDLEALADLLQTFLSPLSAYAITAMGMIRSSPWISNVALAEAIIGKGKANYFNRHVVPQLRAMGYAKLGKGRRWVFPGAPGPLQR
jgi:hypothetical protein